MARNVHSQLAQFRVSDTLLASAADKARRNGMTLSELLRSALRRELGV